MRSGTHFTQQNVLLLFTVVMTKHVWPYFQSRFPKTSSERVSSWDVHGEVGYSISTSMEHHRCFNVYILKTRVTRISDSVLFKHQYITNPQITPETLVMKAAAELTSALKGSVLQDAETEDALAKVSDLFQKIAASKAERAKAKEQRNQHRTVTVDT